MLKLEPVSAEPFWLDVLPGVRIQFRPVSVAAMLIARGAAGEALKAGGEQATIEAGAAFTRALAHTGIVAWEGIGDAKGKPVDPDKASHRAIARTLARLRRHRPPLCRPGADEARRKKRLIALAEWHFDGGESYCAACPFALCGLSL